jgi:dihydropyrimidine dehydrogenase (NAD+) subunit PreA
MHYGFRIVEHMISGMRNWMREKGFQRIGDFQGRARANIVDWGDLDLGYKVVAEIDQSKCIHCGLCYIACEDGCHQSINWERVPQAEFVRRYGAMPEVSGQESAVRSQGSEVRVHGSGASGQGSTASANGNGHGPALVNPNMRFHRSGDVDVLPGAGAEYVGVFTIKQDMCVGCNMCSLVCPAQGCISMKQVPSNLPSMTWKEYQRKLAAGEMEKIQPPEHV